MTLVNVHEAKTTLSKLLERVEQGETFTIARAGRPVAQLGPLPPRGITFGTGRGEVSYDSATFDDEDPAVTALFEGR